MKARNSLFLNEKNYNKCTSFNDEKCSILKVKYSVKDDTLNISGVTFRNDGQKKVFNFSNSPSSDYDRQETNRKSFISPPSVINTISLTVKLGIVVM